MIEPLAELLDQYQYETLLQIAARNDLASTDSSGRKLRKDVLIEVLCRQLYIPERARRAHARLSTIQRTVLDRILLCGGEVDTYILRDQLEHAAILAVETLAQSQANGSAQAGHETRDGWGHPAPPGSPAHPFEEVIGELTLRGLLLSAGNPQPWNPMAKLGLSPGLRVFVPAPVRKGLPQPDLPSVKWGSITLPAPPVETSIALAQRDLFIYWSHARKEPLPLTQSGLVQKRALRGLNGQLLLPDASFAVAGHPTPAAPEGRSDADAPPAREGGTAPSELQAPRLYFMRLMLQELHMLVWQQGKLHAATPEFWDKTVEERTHACLKVWIRLGKWSELSGLGMSSFDLDLERARSILLDQLRILEPGVWLSADRFLARLSMTVSHLLFQSRVGRSSAYYSDSGYLTQQSRRLAEMEAAFAGGALSGPLHWLGVVDISADDPSPAAGDGRYGTSGTEGGGRLLAFRVNGSAAPVLSGNVGHPGTSEQLPATGASALPGAEERARLVVQPNFQIFALGPVPEATLAKIELFADRVKADRSAFEYTLSRAAFYRGQQAGLAATELIAFLEQASGEVLPQNVLRTLQDWGEQHERIVFRRAVSLCEASSPTGLDEMWGDPTTRAYLDQRLTQTTALLKKGRLPALREHLLQRGVLPALSSGADCCAGQVRATPDGELIPIHSGPNLLLDSCLRRLAEPVPAPTSNPTQDKGGIEDPCTQQTAPERADHYQITEAAVSRALTNGLSVNEYLRQLQMVHHGAVPPALQSRIKAWGRYYGRAVLQHAVLLEVKDPATAAELLADAELASLLSRFEADPRGRLLLVETHDLQHLHRLLEERGVEVEQQPQG